ncbi:alpha/beta hydrolase [Lolliginicoccus suaedae]|uniref:alpha/beta hydrolase n=1 Tax=Lolliginicoccus suaedae TaxID=2605429 RepID=UPI0016590FBE|nr:alpha/beta hydrolase [Lolliginicoccus suaedae]
MVSMPKLDPAVMRLAVRTAVRPVLSARLPVRLQRPLIAAASLVSARPSGITRRTITLGGLSAEQATHTTSDPETVVLYLHGGGYTLGSPSTHRSIASYLARYAQATVTTLDYRLAPEHPYPAAVEDAVAAYAALLADGMPPGRIVLAGDSAGGGLVLSTALRLRSSGAPLPAALVLISPWIDLTVSDLSETRDPMLSAPWLRECARRYIAGGPLDAEVDPLHADLAGLPPTLIHVGSDEILLHDAKRLAAHAQEAGVDVTLTVLEGLWHVVHLHSGLLRAATQAVEDIGDFVRHHTGSDTGREAGTARPTSTE